MIKHKRMYCPSCKREWVVPSTGQYQNSSPLTITGNKRNDLCPICGGPDPEYIEYIPPFLGGDIPRPDSDPIPLVISQKQLGENSFGPPPIPHSLGFIQNNLITMLREEQEKK